MKPHRNLGETIDGYVDSEMDDREVLNVYERITDGFLAVDEDRKLIYLNTNAVELLQIDKSEALGEHLWRILPEGKDSVLYEGVVEAIREQSSGSFDAYYQDADIWLRANTYPSEDGVSVYFRDVTEEKERQNQLERYETFFQESSEAITVLDKDGTVLYNSPSVESILDHGQDERVGEKAFEYVHPDDRERVLRSFRNSRRKKKKSQVSSSGSRKAMVHTYGLRVPGKTGVRHRLTASSSTYATSAIPRSTNANLNSRTKRWKKHPSEY